MKKKPETKRRVSARKAQRAYLARTRAAYLASKAPAIEGVVHSYDLALGVMTIRTTDQIARLLVNSLEPTVRVSLAALATAHKEPK